jgi:DME family drug/metabolite transporter
MTGAGRGELYAALAAVGYGSAYVATAFALRSLEPLPVAVDRSLLAAIALAAVVVLRRRAGNGGHAADTTAAPLRPPARTRAIHLLVIAGFGGPIFLAAMNLAIASVGATIASFVAGLYAILAAVLAPFVLREPLRRRALAGFLAALLGTALLAELDIGGTASSGIAWGLIAAGSFAVFLVLSRRWARADGFDGIGVALATMSATAVGLGAVVAVTAPATLLPTAVLPEAIVALGWLTIIAAAGQTLAVASLALVPASRTAAFLLLNPVSATVLAFGLLGERPSPLQLVGGVLVLAGMAAATIERRPRAVVAEAARRRTPAA